MGPHHSGALLPITVIALVSGFFLQIHAHKSFLSKSMHLADTLGETNRPGFRDSKWDAQDEKAILKALGSTKTSLNDVSEPRMLEFLAQHNKTLKYSCIGIFGSLVALMLYSFGFWGWKAIDYKVHYKERVEKDKVFRTYCKESDWYMEAVFALICLLIAALFFWLLLPYLRM